VTIPGVKVADFLRHAVSNIRNPQRKEGEGLIPMKEFRKELRARMDELGIEQEFSRRYLNDGFSGGEKKRMEILQLAMLRPRFAILDETDSGLDSDAVRFVSESLARLFGSDMALVIITHHERLLEFNRPQHTHVMLAGRVVEHGDARLAHELHDQGYAGIRARHPDAAAEEQEQAEALKQAEQSVVKV
jgi:Fe-S cluster assembly ATP-binding protein